MGVPVLNVHLDSAETLDLLEKSGDAHDAAVTDDALRLGLDNTDGNQMESNRLVVVNDGVAGVGTSRGTATEVVPTRSRSAVLEPTDCRSCPPAFPFPRHPTGNPEQRQFLTFGSRMNEKNRILWSFCFRVKLNNQIDETPSWAHGFFPLQSLLVSYCNNSD